MKVSILIAIGLLFTGISCGQKTGTPSEAQPHAAPQAQEQQLAPKDLLTDDKLTRYATYQREMNTVAGITMETAGLAFKKSGGSQKGFEKEMAQDPRMLKIAATETSALSKSGLSRQEAAAIGKLVSAYIPGRSMGTEEDKKKARADFGAQQGPAALAAIDKHEGELIKLQNEMLASLMKKPAN